MALALVNRQRSRLIAFIGGNLYWFSVFLVRCSILTEKSEVLAVEAAFGFPKKSPAHSA
jgi:hypothetical protein